MKVSSAIGTYMQHNLAQKEGQENEICALVELPPERDRR